MENKFTQGQWAIRDLEIIGPIGSNKSICEITGNFMDEVEAEANLKLIAAAPELLHTLTDYIDSMLHPDHVEKWYNQYKDDETANRVLVNAIAAIKSATE